MPVYDGWHLAELLENFPKLPTFKPTYGTAGFRAESGLLHSTLARCGVLMALRAVKTGGVTGIVVTASHNPIEDNGVKLVEPTGYMLDQSWEAVADQLANAVTVEEIRVLLDQVCSQERISNGTGKVLVGYDSRPSSLELAEAAKRGVAAAGGAADVRGLLTTPQLHWMVRRHNRALPDSEGDYFSTMGNAYKRLVGGLAPLSGALVVDCANGVGAGKLQALAELVPELRLDLRNTGKGVLNEGCGADFVQKGMQGTPCVPQGCEGVPADSRCASIDGDADRVVYFSQHGGVLLLFDGDRIAALAALFIRDLIDELRPSTAISVGVVQTAYANGNSTAFMVERLGVEVKLAKTGVKHLHHQAESFDIGIYFEANGHGTILFKDSLIESLQQEAPGSKPAASLLDVAHMVNQAVGDAISGILLVEAALIRRRWTLKEWGDLYKDLPSCMLKVKVPDRNVFTTTKAETEVVTPVGLQAKIDELLPKYLNGRSFVRPSGTEDVVRIYAEAQTQEEARKLAESVASLVEQDIASTA